jgi:DNA-binding protein HU-beta
MAIGKTELAQQVAEQTGLSRPDANRAVDAVLDSITAALQNDDEVRLTGFGSFKVTHTKARTGRNPQTGAPLNIAAGKRPTFTAGSRLKQSVGRK